MAFDFGCDMYLVGIVVFYSYFLEVPSLSYHIPVLKYSLRIAN